MLRKKFVFMICCESSHISFRFQFFRNLRTWKFLKAKCNPMNKKVSPYVKTTFNSVNMTRENVLITSMMDTKLSMEAMRNPFLQNGVIEAKMGTIIFKVCE